METKRFNVKLDTFLRRTLPQDDHERINSSSVLCAALSPGEKPKYRHAVLSHRYIYLTEVPPKSIKLTVHLKAVQAVEMLEDLPDFLDKKDRGNTVHVRIHYKKPLKEKSRPEGSPIFLRQKIPRDNPLSNIEVAVTPFNSTSPLIPKADLPKVLVSVADSGLCNSLSLRQSNSPSSRQRTYPQALQYKQRTSSLSPTSKDSQPFHHSPLLDSSLRASVTFQDETLSNSSEFSPRIYASQTSPLGVDTPTRSHHAFSSSISSNPSSRNHSHKNERSRGLNRLTAGHRSNSSNFLSIPCPHSVPQRSSSSSDLSITHPLINSGRSDGLHLSSTNIPDSLGSTCQLQTSVATSRSETAIIDLYILKHSSDFYHQVMVAWDNWNIHHAYVGQDTQKSSKSPNLSRERFTHLYITLKQQLLQSTMSIEAGARLAHELATAAQKYYVLKRMFWEDCELFDFCVEQLRVHLNRTTSHATADRLEYSLILMDLLYQMMRETHLINKKVILLTRNSGYSTLTLAQIIINNPLKRISGDIEMESLKNELTEKSCGVMYELLQVCLQARWPEAGTTTVSMPKIAETFLQQPYIADFCGHMVRYICTVLGSSPHHPSTIATEGQSRVTLFHITFILDTLIRFSFDTVKLLRTHFVEEFRYFVSVTKAKQRLPEGDILSARTVQLLQAIKTAIV